jgi:glycosyltransferase involved in cell wall biosynthesis
MGINEKAFVSVLMTAYNAEKYISESIDSILNQTFKNFEFIILNDGSTDRTLEIVQSYKDIRIKIIDDGKLGYYKAKKRLITEANGDFIAIMDADDISYDTRLEVEVSFLLNNPEYGLVGTNAEWIDENNKKFGSGFNFNYSPKELKARLLFQNCFVHTSVLIRKSIIDKYQLNYKEIAGEDFDFWVQIAKYSKIKNIPSKLIKYRIHGGNMIHSSWYKLDDGLYNIIREQLIYYFNDNVNENDVKLHYSLINFNKLNNIEDLNALFIWIKKLLLVNNNMHIFDDKYLKKILSERITKKLMRTSKCNIYLIGYILKLFSIVGLINIYNNFFRVIYIIYLSIFKIRLTKDV